MVLFPIRGQDPPSDSRANEIGHSTSYFGSSIKALIGDSSEPVAAEAALNGASATSHLVSPGLCFLTQIGPST